VDHSVPCYCDSCRYWGLMHILPYGRQSVVSHNRVMRITGGSADAHIKVHKVSYSWRLYAVWDSECSWNERYAESCANMRKYSNCAGIRYIYEGFVSRFTRSHFRSHSDVTELSSRLWVWSQWTHKTRLFAATLVRPHPPYRFGCCNVDSGKRKMSPRHKYHAIAEFTCLT
jgi:hypothetical protein